MENGPEPALKEGRLCHVSTAIPELREAEIDQLQMVVVLWETWLHMLPNVVNWEKHREINRGKTTRKGIYNYTQFSKLGIISGNTTCFTMLYIVVRCHEIRCMEKYSANPG